MRAGERAARRSPRTRACPSYVCRRAIGTRTWIPSAPLVFGKPSSPSASSACLTSSATCDRLREADVRRRVEVEEHEVGPVGLVDPRVPRVHVDAAHVHHPEQRELVVHERRVDPLRCRGLSRVETAIATVGIQSGMCFGASFWKKNLPCQPSG